MTTDFKVIQDENGNAISIIMNGVVFVPEKPEVVSVVVEPEVIPVSEPAPIQHGPRPAPLNNHRTTNSFNLFEGTSWGG